MEDKDFAMMTEVAKEIAKEVYLDGGKPVIKRSGELLVLVPRAIKAALLPLEKWVLHREYSLAETEKLLEQKLSKIAPEDIETPEPHIAVPALQYISYCTDNDELRDMYANLLANSMNKVVRNKVHPSYIEIIKQLSPDEAKLLKTIKNMSVIPIIEVRYERENGEGQTVLRKFSNIGIKSSCEMPYDIDQYFDNLSRLGIITPNHGLSRLTNKDPYNELKTHPDIIDIMNLPQSFIDAGYKKTRIVEDYYSVTSYGIAFCSICITSDEHI